MKKKKDMHKMNFVANKHETNVWNVRDNHRINILKFSLCAVAQLSI